MRHFLKPILFTATLLCATAAQAQDTAAENSGEFDIGQSVTPAVGEPYIRETQGDWQIRCIKAAEGEQEGCNLYQLLMNEDGVAVAEFNMFRLPEGGNVVAGSNIVVPLETFLPAQLTIAVDGQNPRAYPYRFCNASGCIARVGFTQAEIDELKRGATGSLRIVPAFADDAEVVLTISLTGFTAAYDSIVPLPAD
ncbi:invasion associated locus B family protein [Yoonia sp.]|uniref:invasion associated locus B family protein n=1 Tax=Yoonia sp. TaxID=2212373 RepID=UPI002FD92F21